MIQPRDYQKLALDGINRFFENGYGNPLVVAPTGSGKSLMIALYCQMAVRDYPGTRCMVLAHVEELIQQNSSCFATVAPEIQHGIYAAALDRRDSTQPVVFAQIQSCYNKGDRFGYVDFCIIDECHTVNPKCMGRYRTLIAKLKELNPQIKIIGFTATPYRLGHGYIDSGHEKVFDGVAYEIPIDTLIDGGYLARPIAPSCQIHADLSNVSMSKGEFVDSEAAQAFEPITFDAVQDVLVKAKDRKAIIVFACNVAHAVSVAAAFKMCGEQSVAVVTGDTPDDEREDVVKRIKAGQLRVLVNCAVFTTGFDAPIVDTVVLLRATQSAALYVQIVGRGLRIYPGKANCLVLDYGDNVKRHGPINMVKPKTPGAKKDSDTVMAKECVSCQCLIAISVKKCPHCNAEQPINITGPNHGATAANDQILADTKPAWHDVLEMTCGKHTKIKDGFLTFSMRVRYRISVHEWVDEWVCPEHQHMNAVRQAEKWMQKRGFSLRGVDAAVATAWPVPKRILVKPDGKYKRVIDCEFDSNWLEKGVAS